MAGKEIFEYALVFGIMGAVVFGWLIFDTRGIGTKFICFCLMAISTCAAFGGHMFLHQERPAPPVGLSMERKERQSPKPVFVTPKGEPVITKREIPPPKPILPSIVDENGNLLPEFVGPDGKPLPMVIDSHGNIISPKPWAQVPNESDETEADVVFTPEPEPGEMGRSDGWEE